MNKFDINFLNNGSSVDDLNQNQLALNMIAVVGKTLSGIGDGIEERNNSNHGQGSSSISIESTNIDNTLAEMCHDIENLRGDCDYYDQGTSVDTGCSDVL